MFYALNFSIDGTKKQDVMLTLVGNIHTTKFVTYKRQKDAPVVDRSLELIPVHRPTHILLKLPT